MTTVDPTPRPHLPRPVRLPAGHYLTLVLTAEQADTVQSFLRARDLWIEPLTGTENDLDPVYGIAGPVR